MTDLVKRLRSNPVTPAIYSQDVAVMREAAEEIERLQAEHKRLTTLTDNWRKEALSGDRQIEKLQSALLAIIHNPPGSAHRIARQALGEKE